MILKTVNWLLLVSFTFSQLATAQASTPLQLSSGTSQSLKSARMLTDNEEAFRSKIETIRSAKRSLRLMYYIYATDETSSYMTQLLIDKAQKENVKVDLLVDFHTNFERWDLFQMMEREGRGNLRVRFYNRPTPSLIRDISFMVAICKTPLTGDACRADRKNQANAAFAEAQAAVKENRPAKLPVLTSTLLAGLYTKNGTAIKTAMALGTGKDIQEVKAMLSAGKATEMSAAEFEQLKVLLTLIRDAKLHGSVSAKLQLGLAMATHGEQIAPILKMFDTLVPDTMKDEFANEDDWQHLTDFLHHKFLLADEETLQMGGRNIENSYHVNTKVNATDKYVFRDTDFIMKFTSAKPELARTFDRLFNARVLVASPSDIKTEMNYELVAKAPQLGQALMGCMATDPNSVTACVTQKSGPLLASDTAREAAQKTNMEAKAQNSIVSRIMSGRMATEPQHAALSPAELSQVSVTYLENIPYDQAGAETPDKRLYFQDGAEDQSRKARGIHLAVEKNIEKVCQLATQDYKSARDKAAFLADVSKQRRIVIHQGYVILPAELLRALGKTVAISAVSGGSTLKCPGVRIEILTNSIPTTDLSVINLFASLQLGALLEQQANSQAYFDQIDDSIVKGRMYPPANIRYFELQAPSEAAARRGVPSQSLHTKMFIFDRESMIVGSANADVRSYYMDTNNAVELRNVPQYNTDYLASVDLQKRESNGEAFYAEKTADLLGGANALAGLKQNSDESTKEKRTALLKQVYQHELTKVAQHFEKKWREKLGSAPSAEELKKLEDRVAKMRQHLPTLAGIVAGINLQMYNMSHNIITGDDAEKMNKAMRQLNTQFELL